MNEKAIVKHFNRCWADDLPITATRVGDWYLATQGYVILRLPLDHLLFDSRRVFPAFPESGQTLRYMRGGEPEVVEASLADVFTKWVQHPASIQLESTNWLKESGKDLARTFRLPDGGRLFVSEEFVQFLLGKTDALEAYQFFGQPLKEDGPQQPVIAHLDGEAVAGLMPMQIIEQAPLFPLG